MATPRKLDDQEHLHLAMHASKQNRHEDAIDHLKHAIELAPGNAQAYYLLGAEHAEIGMYERAANEIAIAVKLDPTLVAACFQLGLLHVTSGRVKEAEETWTPLDKLGEKHPLHLFKKGMLHLVRDQFDDAVAALEKGIALNNVNEALNRDMRNVIKRIQSREPAAASGAAATKPAAGKPAAHTLLSAYKRDGDETGKS